MPAAAGRFPRSMAIFANPSSLSSRYCSLFASVATARRRVYASRATSSWPSMRWQNATISMESSKRSSSSAPQAYPMRVSCTSRESDQLDSYCSSLPYAARTRPAS